MKAKDIIPTSKPRNFVAKNMTTSGAGQHKDKKKAAKQGNVKHKNKEMSEAGMYRHSGSPSAYDRDYASSVSGMGRGPDHRGLGQELSHETNNIAISINGRQWKVVPGRGTADSKEEWSYLNNMKKWAETKSASSGKKWTVSLTGANVTESVTEVSNELRNRYVARASDDYGSANFGARSAKSHPGLEKYGQEQEARAKKRAAGLNRALSDKRTGRDVDEGWKDEGDDFSDWSDYVKEKLTKAAPDQRLGLARKLSQVEVKNFGSTTSSFNKQTGKAQPGLGLTDTVRSALRYFSGEQDSIRRQSDQDGAPGNFSMPFGSVDIAGMENATPAELAVMKKAVNMGPDWASAAGKIYRETGTITHKDLEDIRKDFEGNIEWHKPMYSSPEAQASRERAMSGESVTQESSNDYEQRQKLIKYIAQKKGWDVSDLELAKTTELVLMYKKIKEQDTNESYIQELSSDLLASYKKKAGEQASAADKAGDYEKGNKRFKGIVKATNKQFDNDAKKQK